MAGARHTPTFIRGLPQTKAALAFAERHHASQQRADGTPFIDHPIEVASLLHDDGAPDHLIATGVMHDLIEKTDVTAPDLMQRFGERVTDLVVAVSDDPAIRGYADRKAALRAQVARGGDHALTLFAADKLSKVRELKRETTAGATAIPTPLTQRLVRSRRLKHYRHSVELLEQHLPDSPLVKRLRGELDALLHATQRSFAHTL